MSSARLLPWKTLMILAAVTTVISHVRRVETIDSVIAKMEDTKSKSTSSMDANKTEETSYVGKASSPPPTTSVTTNEITLPPTSSPSPINMTLNQTALKMNTPTQIPQVDAHDDNASDYDIKAPPNTLEIAPSRRYHVFQFSGAEVASTMTANLLTGLFEGKDQGMAYLQCKPIQKKENCNWLQGYTSINDRKRLHHLNMSIVTFNLGFERILTISFSLEMNEWILTSSCPKSNVPMIPILTFFVWSMMTYNTVI
jgi:hypothetical protein